jgi:hypothetical protein
LLPAPEIKIYPENHCNPVSEEIYMIELTPEEQEKAIAEAPKGTWAILLVYFVLMVLGWLFMFYGFFLPHGPVH